MREAQLAPEFLPALLMAVARAPSVHNVQPARWRLSAGGVELFEDTTRRLAAADPQGHDAWVSLGAAWEGMALALSQRELTLAAPELNFDLTRRVALGSPLRPVASAKILAGGSPDPLAAAVLQRRTFRGLFPVHSDSEQAALEAALSSDPELIPIYSRDQRAAVAELYDQANYRYLSDSAYCEELYGWLRFRRSDPRWAVDGLNADCLALNPVVARLAEQALKPKAYGVLRLFGVAGPLVAETTQVLAAPAVVVLTTAIDQHPFALGRQFYRQWLALAAAAVSLAPMSAVVDDLTARARVAALACVPADRRVYMVARAGKVALSQIARSPRLASVQV